MHSRPSALWFAGLLCATVACGSYATTSTPPSDTGPVESSCSVPSGQACATAPLCGCADSQNCILVSAGGSTTFACIAAGARMRNETCSTHADCGRGLACLAWGSRPELCVAYCSTSDDCPSGECVVPDGISVKVCRGCDPVDPEGCGPQGACAVLKDKGGTSYLACLKAGSGTGAGSCGTSGAWCAPGYLCTAPADCRRACWSSADCGGKTCDLLSSGVSYKGKAVGICPL